MKIANANVQLTSQRSYTEEQSKQESLNQWVGNKRPDFAPQNRPQPSALAVDVLTLSLSARTQAQSATQMPISPPPPTDASINAAENVAATDEEAGLEPRFILLKRMIESLTGQTVTLRAVKLGTNTTAPHPTAPQAANTAVAPQRAGYGVEYERHERYSEAEQTTVVANGVINTQDGQSLSFSLQLAMQREYHSQTDVSIRLGDAKRVDPLVLNFDGNAAQLSDTKFSFDLNSDGVTEQMSFVTGNRGFLVLDKNHDGSVNNGQELFGPGTGNGFTELQAYDSDHNQWIDANDPIYQELQVWRKNDQGEDHLTTLAENHVGAIFLGQVGSEFALKNAQNQQQGQVRSTGIYVSEEGEVRSIQQIDLAV